MKPSYSLLLLPLASAAPILLPADCHHTSCLKSSLLSGKPNTPPTTLTDPHFPPHQLSEFALIDGPFDNTPITPSSSTSQSDALSAPKPLSSSYLLSLKHPFSASNPQTPPSPSASSSETEDLPAKPTSALPALRLEDARRYWESLRGAGGKDGPLPTVTEDTKGEKHICGMTLMTERVRMQGVRMARDYSDLMVVGIVVLFLAVVVALEAVEKVGDLRTLFTTRKRHGEIYLSDDEDILVVKKPFFLQAPPPPRYKVSGYSDEKEEEFKYDSDAHESV